MKNNLTKIFSKLIQIIILLLVIPSFIMPSKVIALSEIDEEESIKVGNINTGDLANQGNPDKYLFIGNSKTYYNNFPFMFQRFMKDSGKNVIVREVTRPGHTLTQLWNYDYIKRELTNNQYDYVVLQPRLLANNEEYEAAVNIVNALKNQKPSIKVIINGVSKSGDKYKASSKAQKKMNERYEKLKNKITSECGVETKISYWGQAVIKAINSTSLNKGDFFTDDRHPTTLSSYLGVACLYSTITGKEANCDYDGTVKNDNFSSIKGQQNVWYYQIDKDRWRNDTRGIENKENLKLMRSIAYKTCVGQENGEQKKTKLDLHVDNSPRISLKKKDKSKDKGLNVVITDYSGLKPENIKIYKSNKTTEIKPKLSKTETKNNVTCKIIYTFDKSYFNKNYKEIYIVAKDNHGNYNKSTFNIKKKSKNKYSIDAAPRINDFQVIGNEKQISLKGIDKAGIKYLKIYDLNQKDKNNKSLFIKQENNIEGSKTGKTVKIKLDDLKEKSNEKKGESKNHFYNIKVVAKDVHGRKCKRIINYRLTDK